MKIKFEADSDSDNMTNINVAKALIEHKSNYYNSLLDRECKTATLEVEDLEEIAEYLLVYCKAERKRNGYDA